MDGMTTGKPEDGTKGPDDGRERIALRIDRCGGLDDVVVGAVAMFRAEMMSDRELWMQCTFADSEERLTFWVYAERGKLRFTVTERPEPSDTFTYET